MLRLMLVFNSGAIQIIVIEPNECFDFSKDVADYFAKVGKGEAVAEWFPDKLSNGGVFIRYKDVSFIKATEIPRSEWDSMSTKGRQTMYGTAA